jgi:phosphatidylinositol glycan class F
MDLSIGFCYLQLIAITYTVTVLMGAPFLSDMIRTLLFSIYIVVIGFTPVIIHLKGKLKQIYIFVFQNEFYNNFYQVLIKNLVWGTVIGAWAGAIPIPLDWDRWWQRWPITCLVSSTIGACFSVIFSYSSLWIRNKQKYNEDIE